jgi:hypothetical protein
LVCRFAIASSGPELDLEFLTIDNVFWYIKHAHYTLVWI